MKKLFTLLLASFILLSGMHFSIAKHFCGDRIADVKISFSEAKASCGMENNDKTCSITGELTSNCCRNDISILSIDHYFNSTTLQIKEVNQSVSQLFFLPLIQSLYSLVPTFQAYTDVSPADNLLANGVSLPKICVFRI